MDKVRANYGPIEACWYIYTHLGAPFTNMK